ncbi:MAG: PASTA domain-containing protein [Armatimonadetes bacterium]|nr:PASTA domain-containing protein [Armatimonadota bacterium]
MRNLLIWLLLLVCPAWPESMPDVLGKDLDSAQAALRDAGIEHWQVLRSPTQTGVDTIVRQAPLAGTRMEERTGTPRLYLGVPYREKSRLKPSQEKKPAPEPSSGSRFSWLLFFLVQALVGLVLWRGRHLLGPEE